jgi:hypothetical protein
MSLRETGERMNTPLKVGDRVHNPVQGQGSVTGFVFPEGCGEWVEVVFDAQAPAALNIERKDIRRVLGMRAGSLVLGG